MRYFYQVNTYGDPIQGSNVNIKNKPRTFGAGQKWVEFIPTGLLYPCCEDGPYKITSLGKKWRYYVRLRNSGVINAPLLPIAGTLMKHQQKPANGDYQWQEIVGKYQCATQPQFNVNIPADSFSTTIVDLFEALKLPNTLEFVPFSGGTERGGWLIDLQADGTLTIDADSGVEDIVTLQYTNGDCEFAFQVTVVPIA